MSVVLFLIFFLTDEQLKLNAHYFLFFHIMSVLLLFNNNTLKLFSPISIIYFYTAVSLFFGSWGFSSEKVLTEHFLLNYYNWDFINISFFYLILSLSIFVIIGNKLIPNKVPKLFPVKISSKSVLISFVLFIPFFFLSLKIGFLGGNDLSSIPRTLFALILIFKAQEHKNFIKFSIYFIVVLILATFSVDSKREALIVVLPILFNEFVLNDLRINWKNFSITAIFFTYCIFLILAMSIVRGYGNFGSFNNIFQAISYIPVYIESDFFISALLLNIEANYFFFHAINSIELILENPNLISLGSTMIKPLFIFIPREIFFYKPESILTLYTSEFEIAFRSIGGSYPISVFSEFFWNFHFFGIFFVIVLALFCSFIYRQLLGSFRQNNIYKLLFYTIMYSNLLFYARGSGLDLFFIYVLLSGFFIYLFNLAHKIIVSVNTNNDL